MKSREFWMKSYLSGMSRASVTASLCQAELRALTGYNPDSGFPNTHANPRTRRSGRRSLWWPGDS